MASMHDVPDLTGQITRFPGQSFGKGAFSDVYKGEWKTANIILVALKVFRTKPDQKEEIEHTKIYIRREAAVWKTLHHLNILSFKGFYIDEGISCTPILVSSYCQNGNALDYVRNREDNEGIRTPLLLGVARGLDYLHSRGILHGDLKAANVLVTDDGEAALCDFGLSRIMSATGFTTVLKGSYRYMAPELLLLEEGTSHALTRESDVYSFAMTALEILTTQIPFYSLKQDPPVIRRVTFSQRPDWKEYTVPINGDGIKTVIEKCWCQEPEDRLVIGEIIRELETA